MLKGFQCFRFSRVKSTAVNGIWRALYSLDTTKRAAAVGEVGSSSQADIRHGNRSHVHFKLSNKQMAFVAPPAPAAPAAHLAYEQDDSLAGDHTGRQQVCRAIH